MPDVLFSSADMILGAAIIGMGGLLIEIRIQIGIIKACLPGCGKKGKKPKSSESDNNCVGE